jgi:uncharacterized surface protein with fasciclin (FAS1) repeats
MRKLFISSLFLSLLVVFAGCDKRGRNDIYPPGIQDNIIEVAQTDPELSVFVAALKVAGMDTTFESLGFVTVLAPTNAAFSAIGINASNVGTALPVATLRAVLRYHMLGGSVPAANLAPGPNASYTTLQNDAILTSTYSSVNPGTWFNGRARVLKADIKANNGIIHKINGVLLPPPGNLWQTINANTNLTFLAAAITRAGLVSVFDAAQTATVPGYVLFAPTNAAFQAAGYADIAAINAAPVATLGSILGYHAISSTTLNAVVGTPLGLRGRLFSVDLRDGMSLPTIALGSPTITVSTTGTPGVRGTANTSNCNITAADQIARNGVIHVIDRVLLR